MDFEKPPEVQLAINVGCPKREAVTGLAEVYKKMNIGAAVTAAQALVARGDCIVVPPDIRLFETSSGMTVTGREGTVRVTGVAPSPNLKTHFYVLAQLVGIEASLPKDSRRGSAINETRSMAFQAKARFGERLMGKGRID